MGCIYCEKHCLHKGYGQEKPLIKNEVCLIAKQFNIVQAEVLAKHLDKHKWFRGIKDQMEAELDFVREFAPIERQVVCGVCIHHGNCLVEEEVIK
jgi:hypothetical protein